MKTKLLLFAALCVGVNAADMIQEPAQISPAVIGDWMLPRNTQAIAVYSFDVKEYARQNDLVVITKQEAADVVRAMEILSAASKHWGAPIPDADDPKYEGEGGPQRYLVEYVEMADKYKADLKWSRSILAAWKEKVGAGK